MFTRREYFEAYLEVVGKFIDASLRALRDPPWPVMKLNPALNERCMQFTCKALRDGLFVAGEGIQWRTARPYGSWNAG